MRRLSLVLFCLLVIQNGIAANILVLNSNKSNDINIIYKLCDLEYTTSKEVCYSEIPLTIKAKVSSDIQNYEVIKSTIPSRPFHTISVVFLSANEKDNQGNIIAQSSFWPMDYTLSNNAQDFDQTYVIPFSDNNGSPFITNESLRLKDLDK